MSNIPIGNEMRDLIEHLRDADIFKPDTEQKNHAMVLTKEDKGIIYFALNRLLERSQKELEQNEFSQISNLRDYFTNDPINENYRDIIIRPK